VIYLSELLSSWGFVPDPKRVKLIRHKDARFDLQTLRAQDWFDTYQKHQSKPVFASW
jgi:hypothetical protein